MPPNYDNYAQPPAQGLGGFYDPTAYSDTSYGQDKSGKQGGGGGAGTEFDDEPPLLEGKMSKQTLIIVPFPVVSCTYICNRSKKFV